MQAGSNGHAAPAAAAAAGRSRRSISPQTEAAIDASAAAMSAAAAAAADVLTERILHTEETIGKLRGETLMQPLAGFVRPYGLHHHPPPAPVQRPPWFAANPPPAQAPRENKLSTALGGLASFASTLRARGELEPDASQRQQQPQQQHRAGSASRAASLGSGAATHAPPPVAADAGKAPADGRPQLPLYERLSRSNYTKRDAVPPLQRDASWAYGSSRSQLSSKGGAPPALAFGRRLRMGPDALFGSTSPA